MSGADPQGIRDAALALPEHLRDALWRIETAKLHPMEAPAAFVCGMGGSAIGGDLAAAALGDRLSKPLMTVRGYELPSWAPAGSAVLCSSYSGNTEETLACYAAAEALGAHRLVATTGGELAEMARRDDVPVVGLPGLLPQPRTAVGYLFCVAAELAVLALAAPRIATEIDAAAAHLERAHRGAGGARRGARRAAGRRGAGHLWLGPDCRGGLPLEDAGEREREDAGLLLGPARGRPQRAPRLDPHQAGRGLAGAHPAPGSRPAPPRAAPDRAHRRGGRPLRRDGPDGRGRGRDPHRARPGAGHARRPDVAGARGAARASTRARSTRSRS